MLIEANKVIKPSRIYAYPWIGTVVANNDPKKLCRVKVNIPGLLEGSPDDLPWVMVKNPTGLGGTGNTSGFIVPVLNSTVNVHFPYDDIYFPVYDGFYQSQQTHQSVFDEDYPDSYGFVDEWVTVKANRKTKAINIETTNGMKLKLLENGDIEIEGATKITAKAPEIILNEKLSGVTTSNSHFNVVDFITGVEVIPSITTFGDV